MLEAARVVIIAASVVAAVFVVIVFWRSAFLLVSLAIMALAVWAAIQNERTLDQISAPVRTWMRGS